MNNILPFQPEFRPAIPCVRGNVDYSRFEGELVRIDEILRVGGIEDYFVKLSTEHWMANFEEGEEPRAKPAACGTHRQADSQASATQSSRPLCQ